MMVHLLYQMHYASNKVKDTILRLVTKVTVGVARHALLKSKMKVVGINGSVGKTTTRYAIAEALRCAGLRVRTPVKNFNSELGIGCAILNIREYLTSFRGIYAWAKGILCGIFFKIDDDILVIEYGSDAPGDIARLMKIAPPHIAVLTSVTVAHAAAFDHLGEKANEMMNLENSSHIFYAKKIVVNGDDPHAIQCARSVQNDIKISTFGFSGLWKIISHEPDISPHGFLHGWKAKYDTPYGDLEMKLPQRGGVQQVYPIMAAAAVADTLGVFNRNIFSALQEVSWLPPSRMRILPKKNDGYIVDDTYNSSPSALHAFIDSMYEVCKRSSHSHILIVGDMNELGMRSDEYHTNCGRYAFERLSTLPVPIRLITVGTQSRYFSAQWPGSTHFNSSDEFLETEAHNLSAYGIWLKGSQDKIRLERVVRLLKSDSVQDDLICRKDW